MADTADKAARDTPLGTSAADVLVLLPSVAYSDGLLDALPFIRYYGERSLSDLAALRDPHRHVVLLTAEPIDPWIVNRTIADLSEGDARLRRDMHRRLECLVPDRRRGEPLADAVLADPRTMQWLRDTLRGARSALLVNFSASPATDRLAAELGVMAEEGPFGPADECGTKAGSKAVFRQAGGVLCARGDLEVVRSVDAATRAARRLAAADPPPERVIVKLNASDWGDGLGNVVLDCATLLRTGSLRDSIESLPQPWEDYCRELADGGAIIEEYIADATAWPSAQGRITADGEFQLLAAHQQILVAGEYRGCCFPLEPQTSGVVAGATARVGAALERHGIRGSFGVDFIVAGGRTYATEINVRKVGPSHVIKAVHARAGTGPRGDGRGSIMGMPIAYVDRRLHRPELLTALTPQSALQALNNEDLIYERATRTGVLLHIMGALQPVGFVETTSLAATPAQARVLDQRAEEVLTAAARRAMDSTPLTNG